MSPTDATRGPTGPSAAPRRVFLSHTSDLGRPDEPGSFVAAAVAAGPCPTMNGEIYVGLMSGDRASPRLDVRNRVGGRLLRLVNPLVRRLIPAGLPTCSRPRMVGGPASCGRDGSACSNSTVARSCSRLWRDRLGRKPAGERRGDSHPSRRPPHSCTGGRAQARGRGSCAAARAPTVPTVARHACTARAPLQATHRCPMAVADPRR